MKVFRPLEHLPLEEYLALEAELVKSVDEPTLFTWIVSPTVIYGRHQVREQEVNEAYCSAHKVRVVQRKSGGGCVYADAGNLMVSCVSPSNHQSPTTNYQLSIINYQFFMRMLADALRQLGYEAVTTSHNDILVGGRKVVGTASYQTPTGTVVHACIAYDVDINAMEQALTPSEAKLQKHAVASVRQRVRNLRDIIDIGDISAFRIQLEEILTSKLYYTILPVSD
ncbi:MAG: lipoate--protein ligase family protein [Paludibacteraceae bacterium]|nr:lipoate--protein ligase family protein [Paludibacteraceae bacterium]